MEVGPSNSLFARYAMDWSSGSWCVVECYLSFVKLRMTALEFTQMRTNISDVLGRSLKERPFRGLLQSHGGAMTLEEYHGKEKVPELFEVREKRHIQ